MMSRRTLLEPARGAWGGVVGLTLLLSGVAACSSFGGGPNIPVHPDAGDARDGSALPDGKPDPNFGELTVVASEQPGLGVVACDETAAYVTTEEPQSRSGSVLRLPVSGPVQQLAGAQSQPHGMGLHDTRVFWTAAENNRWYLRSAAKVGGPFDFIHEQVPGYTNLVVVGTESAWSIPLLKEVFRAGVVSGLSTRVAQNQVELGRIGLAGGQVYWAAGGAIWRASSDAVAPELVLAPHPRLSEIVLDAEDVYFAADDGTVGAVSQQPPANSVRTLTTEARVPRSLALFGDRVYWINSGAMPPTVATVEKGGGSPRILAEAEATSALAVCGMGVYFTMPGARVVKRIAKK